MPCFRPFVLGGGGGDGRTRLVHDIFRLILARFATEKALPFEPLVPTPTTVTAIEEARRGGLKEFANSRALLKSLIADD